MNNVIEISELEYKEADEVKTTFRQRLQLFWSGLVLITKASVLLQYELLKAFLKLFLPSRPECVRGQLCLITGGANGLGRYLAMRFAKEGCDIAIVDIVNYDRTVEEIVSKFKVNCRGFKCDVSDNDSVLTMRKEVEASMGHVDILVNNAGLLFGGHLLLSKMENIRKCVDVNLIAHYQVLAGR